jgi:hypothetical protein
MNLTIGIQAFRHLMPVPENEPTIIDKLGLGGDLMYYDDWPNLLSSLVWRLSLTLVIVEFLPGFKLCVPFLLTKRVKVYFVKKHIYIGLCGHLPNFLSQPDLCKSSSL